MISALASEPGDLAGGVVAGAAFGFDELACLGIDEGLIFASAGEPGEQHVQSL